MNSTRVLDASVLVAVLNNEPYRDETLDIIPGAIMSSVNSAEVWTKMHEFGLIDDPRIQQLFDLLDEIVPFTDAQARLTGDLRPITRSRGLSLGDRACLATAIAFGADVYTMESRWLEITLPCVIHRIR